MNRNGPSDEEREMVRQALVVDYKTIFSQLLDRVKKLVVLDDRGNSRLAVARDELTDAQVLALELVGRKFAHTIGLLPTDTMSVEELSKATGILYKTVTARVSGLRRKGWVDSDARGEYRVVYTSIEAILREAETRKGAR